MEQRTCPFYPHFPLTVVNSPLFLVGFLVYLVYLAQGYVIRKHLQDEEAATRKRRKHTTMNNFQLVPLITRHDQDPFPLPISISPSNARCQAASCFGLWVYKGRIARANCHGFRTYAKCASSSHATGLFISAPASTNANPFLFPFSPNNERAMAPLQPVVEHHASPFYRCFELFPVCVSCRRRRRVVNDMIVRKRVCTICAPMWRAAAIWLSELTTEHEAEGRMIKKRNGSLPFLYRKCKNAMKKRVRRKTNGCGIAETRNREERERSKKDNSNNKKPSALSSCTGM